jgi:glucose-1-phosphate cytidylyltransferase
VQVLILCGGKGTRSYPFTEYLPKVMMPIKGRPILVHLMEIYARQGFTDFVLAAGHRQEILRDYFEGRFQNWNIRLVDTGEESDTADRVIKCKQYLGDRFFATYGDGLGNVNLQRLVEFHKNAGGLATVTSVPLRSQYGTVVTGQDGRILRFQEKPVLEDHWINAGYFVFEKQIFNHWSGHNLECDVFPNLASQGATYAYRHHGFWKSMDTSKEQQELERLCQDQPPWLEDIFDHRDLAGVAV